MRALLAAALLLTLAFAGCADGGGDGDKSSTTTSPSASGSASKSGTKSSTGSSTATGTGAPGNRAPTGQLAASLENGSIPLRVNFTLNGTDADGDALSWSLSFGDGNATQGSALPATAAHNYTRVGNFTVRYNVTDGKANATYNVTIRVGAGGSAGGVTAVFVEGQAVPSNPINSAMIPNVGYAGATGCAGYWDGTSGFDCVFFELLADYAGKSFTATADAGNPDLEFWPVCDPAEVFAVAGFAVDGPESGVIPDGALCVVIWNGEPSTDTPTHTFTVL